MLRLSKQQRHKSKSESGRKLTKPLPFSESTVRRVVLAVQKAGLQVNAVSVAPDGTVTVYRDLKSPEPKPDDKDAAEWSP